VLGVLDALAGRVGPLVLLLWEALDVATRVHLGGTPVWVDLRSGTDMGTDESEARGPSRVRAVLTAHPGQDTCVECRDLCLP
jgi:hypothetical protein